MIADRCDADRCDVDAVVVVVLREVTPALVVVENAFEDLPARDVIAKVNLLRALPKPVQLTAGEPDKASSMRRIPVGTVSRTVYIYGI